MHNLRTCLSCQYTFVRGNSNVHQPPLFKLANATARALRSSALNWRLWSVIRSIPPSRCEFTCCQAEPPVHGKLIITMLPGSLAFASAS